MYILFVFGLPWHQPRVQNLLQVRKKNYLLSHMYLSENRKQKQKQSKNKNEIKYNAQINMYDLTKFGGTEGIF